MMEAAAFSFVEYKFTQVHLDLEDLNADQLSLDIQPSGIFRRECREYQLTFDFYARAREDKEIIHVRCVSLFQLSGEELPDYFYANSIAIVFPYVRAFISTISLQANITPPIVLPTLNLSSLRDRLVRATRIL